MNAGHTTSPAIRLVVIIMLLLTLAVPAGMYFAQNLALRTTSETHHPKRMEMALKTLEKSIQVRHDSFSEISFDALVTGLDECTDDFGKNGTASDFEALQSNLQTLNQHLSALAGGDMEVGNRFLNGKYAVDIDVWLANAKEGLRQHLFSCQDLQSASRWLAGPSGKKVLSEARWAEFERFDPKDKLASKVPVVEFSSGVLSQTDPWKGWPGCIWLKSANSAERQAWYIAPAAGSRWGRALCEQKDMQPDGVDEVAAAVNKSKGLSTNSDDASWLIPDSLDILLADLEHLRIPAGAYYQDLSRSTGHEGNRRKLRSVELDIGYHVQLTIDPSTQRRAQQIARCYTGERRVCRMLGLDADIIGAGRVDGKLVYPGAKQMWEGAAARMTAIVVLDIASGRIEALASAHTDCYRQERDGPGRDKGCPPLWTNPQRRPDSLLNHAVFEAYSPGSTIKPIMASVFLEDNVSGDAIKGEIAKSDSIAFLDRMFCVDRQSALPGSSKLSSSSCDRPLRIQRRVAELGWNLGCSAIPSKDCGQMDLLFGRPSFRKLALEANDLPLRSRPLSRDILLGRALVERPSHSNDDLTPPAGFQLNEHLAINLENAKACAKKRWDRDATQCKAIGNLGALRSEGYGQGQARATPIGVAAMVARISAASQGRSELRFPHLVERIADVNGQSVQTIATQAVGGQAPFARSEGTFVKMEVAQQVLAGMADGARIGTGFNSCISVFGRANCETGRANFAGKTGTTSFNFDGNTLGYISKNECNSRKWSADCDQRPMKWYVAAYNSRNTFTNEKLTGARGYQSYDKVVAVLTERNWYSPGSSFPNRVHGLKADGAVNISAEIGMRVMAGNGVVQ